MRKKVFLLFLFFLLFSGSVFAKEREINFANTTCVVYFTGVGCPHCAKTDPVVLEKLPEKYPQLVIIEYEIYRERENAPLLSEYNEVYQSGLGVPLVIFGRKKHIIGDLPILKNFETFLEEENPCPLIGGKSVPFSALDLSSLPGKPKIWRGGRIFLGNGRKVKSDVVKRFLNGEEIGRVLEGIKFEKIPAEPVALSGKSLEFEQAVRIEGGVLQWNGPPPPKSGGKIERETGEKRGELLKELTLAKVVSLALVDSVNPCALAVLTLVLIAILTSNPQKRRNLLLAGFAFTTSVFVMYLFYGLVIIRFFQIVQALANIRLYLYKILGFLAIILGVLNIKDFISYKPGGLGTEMPMSLRPKVQKILLGLTSPKGAFGVGVFVTVFLLPCTIGPYIICGGLLCPLSILEALPWLLLYNLIFVLPMIGITLACYIGFTTVENVSGWREKNIRYLHLFAGLIILGLGVGMLAGLV